MSIAPQHRTRRGFSRGRSRKILACVLRVLSGYPFGYFSDTSRANRCRFFSHLGSSKVRVCACVREGGTYGPLSANLSSRRIENHQFSAQFAIFPKNSFFARSLQHEKYVPGRAFGSRPDLLKNLRSVGHLQKLCKLFPQTFICL